MTDDPLRPSATAVLDAWAERVRANREQVERYREVENARDFYAPVVGMFHADPRRTDEAALEVLRGLVRPDDTVLDIGAGGGRYALPLALAAREVVAVDPSPGMLDVLRQGMAEHGIQNVRPLPGRWPEAAGVAGTADVALIAHVGYDVEAIGPFLDAMERSARRLCVAVLLSQPPPTEADRLWPAVHGVERATLPALPEFLVLQVARGRLCEVRLVPREPQRFADPAQAETWLGMQLWTRPGGAKHDRLLSLARERMRAAPEGRVALSERPVPLGIVTWRPGEG